MISWSRLRHPQWRDTARWLMFSMGAGDTESAPRMLTEGYDILSSAMAAPGKTRAFLADLMRRMGLSDAQIREAFDGR